MAHRSDTLRVWSPRILAVAVSLFFTLFALDSFAEGETFLRSLPQFLIHTAPTLILLGAVAAAWRREWLGGLLFTGLAACYAGFARHHVTWILTISGPLLVVGVLYFWSWAHRRRQRIIT